MSQSEAKKSDSLELFKIDIKKTKHKLFPGDREIEYRAKSGTIQLYKDDKPLASMFSTSYYIKAKDIKRPVTFCFNGGPGASSAYLHLGALGPKRVVFGDEGQTLSGPTELIDNKETWVSFTDLVFVDPVGTGYSRMYPQEKQEDEKGGKPHDKKEYFKLQRDLESLCEFIVRYLNKNKLWDRPIYIAGESYGGFRVAKLAKLLQQSYGVSLSGAILISPAMEWMLLSSSDYDVLPWVDLFPTMALAARSHNKSARLSKESLQHAMEQVEKFALDKFINYLAKGDYCTEEEKEEIAQEASEYLGIDKEVLLEKNGRILIHVFSRLLLKKERLICGLYDATITSEDPFPDREFSLGPDKTWHGIERVYTAGVNKLLGEYLKIKSDLEYKMIAYDVNKAWEVDTQNHAFERQVGATDDLRFALGLNDHMKVFWTHGLYDLVTPYFSSNRIMHSMKLTDAMKSRITMKHFKGGHMFYTWKESREQFTQCIKGFMEEK